MHHWKVYLAGAVKSAGKTTFALTAPPPTLVLQFDQGGTSIPPGVDPGSVSIREYTRALPAFLLDKEGTISSSDWKKSAETGEAMWKDAMTIRSSFLRKDPEIILANGQVLPLPTSIVIDGATNMADFIGDWTLSKDGKTGPDDYSNRFAFWRKRLHNSLAYLNYFLPLGANVVIAGWEMAESKTIVSPAGKELQIPTGRITADLGGQLNTQVPGGVGAALHAYSELKDGILRYFIQTQRDTVRDWVAVRGIYGLRSPIDVTIKPGDKDLPWARVFGKEDSCQPK